MMEGDDRAARAIGYASHGQAEPLPSLCSPLGQVQEFGDFFPAIENPHALAPWVGKSRVMSFFVGLLVDPRLRTVTSTVIRLTESVALDLVR